MYGMQRCTPYVKIFPLRAGQGTKNLDSERKIRTRGSDRKSVQGSQKAVLFKQRSEETKESDYPTLKVKIDQVNGPNFEK
jgi:hypothetical protein